MFYEPQKTLGMILEIANLLLKLKIMVHIKSPFFQLEHKVKTPNCNIFYSPTL